MKKMNNYKEQKIKTTKPKKQITAVYIETQKESTWKVYVDKIWVGDIYEKEYIFPVNLFIKKEYWFFPSVDEYVLQFTTAKTKEQAFEKFIKKYCESEIKEHKKGILIKKKEHEDEKQLQQRRT